MINTFKIKALWRGKVLGVVFLALMVCLLAAPSAKAASIDLGTAADFAVLGLGSAVTINGSATSVTGDVGVNLVGPLTGSGTINGTAWVDGPTPPFTTTSVSFSGTITGGKPPTTNHNKVSTAKNDAQTAFNTYGVLGATAGTTDILAVGANTTINVTDFFPTAGNRTVVYTLNNTSNPFKLDGGVTLTLNGTASDVFIFNVFGLAEFDGTLQLTGGLLPQNVLFNEKSIGGELLVNDFGVMGGILLDTLGATVVHGQVTGEAIGLSVNVDSGGFVRTPPPVPIPPSAILFGSGLLGLGILGRRKWFG